MASSADKQTHHLPAVHGATVAPPPTPSSLPAGNHSSTTDATADLLSRLFHRLPPNLSLPSRFSKPPPTTTPLPTLSFSALSNDNNLLSASLQTAAVFQLTDHGIPSQLAGAAESESTAALFGLSPEQKESFNFQKEWPLGYENDGDGESFCLDSLCSAEFSSTELDLAPLRKFTREMEGVGLRVVEFLSAAVGFKNPFKEDPTRACPLLWISKRIKGNDSTEDESSDGFYPFVVGLHYQIRSGQKYSLFTDSGRVSVLPEVGSLMVTVGDIAQVWSNGKLRKKVRGRSIPMHSSSSAENNTTTTISLLITLPLDNAVTVSPQLLTTNDLDKSVVPANYEIKNYEDDEEEEEEEISLIVEDEEKLHFTSFPFEDYAWRVYNERVPLKDPLNRYRLF